MKHTASMGVVLISLALAHTPAGAQTSTAQMRFEGRATSPSDGELLYRERHRILGQCVDGQWRPEAHRVDYMEPGSSEPFAEKQLGFPGRLFQPRVDFRQPSYDERVQVTATEDTLDVRWHNGAGDTRQWSLDIQDSLVVDAGFDHFIRHHWPDLTGGEAVEFRFLAPTRGEAYGFIAEPAPEPLPGADHSFQIRPTGLLMQMLVDPIRLGYRNDGFLTHYVGLGNIRRNQDENYDVAIAYQLQSPPPCPLLSSP